MPWIAFAVLMGHMSVSHLYRQAVNDPGVVDVTGAQMVLVMKLTAFCWNVHDGRMKDEDLTEFQRERAVRKMPGFLDYAGYVLFFPSLMAGPAFDYVEYARYISTSMFDLPPGVDPSKAPPTRKKRRIPRSGTPSTIKLVTGLTWILAFLYLSGKYTRNLLLSDDFLEYSFVYRTFIVYLFGFTQRTKYYGIWSLAEGSCILAGIGYAGIDVKTGRANWDRLVNIKPIPLEMAQNARAYLGNWNMNTNNWLRNYIYLRVTPKGTKPGFRSTLATFLTSAMWHGFYPGYYLTFIMGAFLQNIAQSMYFPYHLPLIPQADIYFKDSRRLIRPFFLTSDGQPSSYKIYYDFLSWVLTQFFFAFTVVPFAILEVKPTLEIWSRVHYFGLIGVILAQIVLQSPLKGMLSQKAKGRLDRPGMTRTKSDHGDGVMLGVPVDAEKELNELVDEVKAEIERRKRAGLTIPDIRTLVKEKLSAVGAPAVDKAKIQEVKEQVKKEL
jgi:lysophospholipid acyltransferase